MSRPVARIIRVAREQGEGGWFYATSPDIRGLIVTEPTLEELDAAIPPAISSHYEARGLDVIVTRSEGNTGDYLSWIAIPAGLIREALLEKESPRA